MLQCVFIARKNSFNFFLADWLAAYTHLRAIVWTDTLRKSWGWRRRWLKRSLKQVGAIGTLDRLAFRLWWLRSEEVPRGWSKLMYDVRKGTCVKGKARHITQIHTHSANSAEVKNLFARLQPDIAFVTCIAERLKKDIWQLPRLGTYIYHEGLTPEYRGLHTVFWALANGDYDKIGYTLLRANDELDGGDVYAQGVTKLDPLATSVGYLGHWALFEGLQDVQRVLKELEGGTARAIDTHGRKDGYYSYFTFSQLWRILRRRRQLGISVDPSTVKKPARRRFW